MKFFLAALCCLSWHIAFSQDSTAYNMQRAKINSLLAERSQKFGQYDESLKARSGIFGFQTKRDLKNSNEILRQIALNDNKIFLELKTLLDYKDLQVQEVQTHVNTTGQNLMGYKNAIKNLQNENHRLINDLNQVERSINIFYIIIFILVIMCSVLGWKVARNGKQTAKAQSL